MVYHGEQMKGEKDLKTKSKKAKSVEGARNFSLKKR